MRIADALRNIQLLCVETAPFIYFVEQYPVYIEKMRSIFQHVSDGNIEVITSTITLTETLTKPLKVVDNNLENSYRNLFLNTRHIRLISINSSIAYRAAQLRALYGLKTPDALQVACAIESNCQAFLTNDAGIKRVQEIRVMMIDELELDPQSDPQ